MSVIAYPCPNVVKVSLGGSCSHEIVPIQKKRNQIVIQNWIDICLYNKPQITYFEAQNNYRNHELKLRQHLYNKLWIASFGI